jgi:hypothetical protein
MPPQSELIWDAKILESIFVGQYQSKSQARSASSERLTGTDGASKSHALCKQLENRGKVAGTRQSFGVCRYRPLELGYRYAYDVRQSRRSINLKL